MIKDFRSSIWYDSLHVREDIPCKTLNAYTSEKPIENIYKEVLDKEIIHKIQIQI